MIKNCAASLKIASKIPVKTHLWSILNEFVNCSIFKSRYGGKVEQNIQTVVSM